MSIDEDDTADDDDASEDDGVAEELKEEDSDADGDSEDEIEELIEDEALSEDTLADNDEMISELVEDGVADGAVLETEVEDVRPELVAEADGDGLLLELTLETDDDSVLLEPTLDTEDDPAWPELALETEDNLLDEIDVDLSDKVDTFAGEHVPKPDWHPFPQYPDVLPQYPYLSQPEHVRPRLVDLIPFPYPQRASVVILSADGEDEAAGGAEEERVLVRSAVRGPEGEQFPNADLQPVPQYLCMLVEVFIVYMETVSYDEEDPQYPYLMVVSLWNTPPYIRDILRAAIAKHRAKASISLRASTDTILGDGGFPWIGRIAGSVAGLAAITAVLGSRTTPADPGQPAPE
ncbi:hypothetical protein BKA63DRAFT_568750 [Paraphoma chrysanthemicola]|nr:hypothetical protein BKA63DRAFT_568750 [Paraphoma chrysanthemicola]